MHRRLGIADTAEGEGPGVMNAQLVVRPILSTSSGLQHFQIRDHSRSPGGVTLMVVSTKLPTKRDKADLDIFSKSNSNPQPSSVGLIPLYTPPGNMLAFGPCNRV